MEGDAFATPDREASSAALGRSEDTNEAEALLADLDVLVVDAQATGASPRFGELLEIGWCTTRASERAAEVRSRWLSLSQGTRVSRVVRELTGYRDAFAADAAVPESVWRELRAAASSVTRDGVPAPTVIHFARFEESFLRDWQIRFGDAHEGSLPFDIVCLHALARRLYPDLPRMGLRALAGYLGHGASLERRSGGHVEASVHVWKSVVAELAGRGIVSWSELAGFSREGSSRPRNRTFPLPKELRKALPDRPGVYRFLRSNGDVLYVGKATSLKKRVAGHFTAAPKNGERAMEMLTQARDLSFIETPTVLEAALLECDEIKRIDPPYNIHLRERAAWFVDASLEDAVVLRDDAHSLGPLPARGAVAGHAAIRRLVSGEARTPLLRARAVGAPLAFAPDDAVFVAGWELFSSKHLLGPARTPLGRLARAAVRLRLLFQEGALEERAEDAPAGWDAPRIVRHLERSVLAGGQLLRRARWLTLLADAVITYEEQGRRRVVVLCEADVVEVSDASDRPLDPGPRRTWRDRQAAFDGPRYDRLRVLGTELRRVIGEGGFAEARLPGGARLGTDVLRRLLGQV